MQSRQAGHRVGENLQSIIPLIVFYCQCKDEELVEYSLQAFESFVRRCPKEISNYIKDVFNLNLRSIKFIPKTWNSIPEHLFWNSVPKHGVINFFKILNFFLAFFFEFHFLFKLSN